MIYGYVVYYIGFYLFIFVWFDNHRNLTDIVGQPDWKRDDRYCIDTNQNRFPVMTTILTNSLTWIGRRPQQYIILLCRFNDGPLSVNSKERISRYIDFEITYCSIGRCYSIILSYREPTDIIVITSVSIGYDSILHGFHPKILRNSLEVCIAMIR